MNANDLSLWADVSAVVLVAIICLFLTAVTGAFVVLWLRLGAAQKPSREAIRRFGTRVTSLQSTLRSVTAATLEPPIRAASTWAGVRAGLAALVGRQEPTRSAERPAPEERTGI